MSPASARGEMVGPAVVFGLAAMAAEACVPLLVLRPRPPLEPLHAVLFHLAAAGLCALSVRLSHPRSQADHDAALLTALLVPLFGPCAAWLQPLRARGEPDAHAMFAAYEEITRAGPSRLALDHRRRGPSARQPLSFAEVFRHGSVDHRRNALRKLAQLGRPRHLKILRTCLSHEDVELRLCAFAEIDRLCRLREDRLAALRAELRRLGPAAEPDHRSDALRRKAEIHYEYATSGLLDPQMRMHHLQRSARHAEEAWNAVPGGWRAGRVAALALAELGEVSHAEEALRRLPEASRRRPEIRLARAKVAFRKRDFAAARRECDGLLQMHLRPPAWLRALGESRA